MTEKRRCVEIRVDLLASHRVHELLAVVDDATEMREPVKGLVPRMIGRRIVGTIQKKGSLWREFMEQLPSNEAKTGTDGLTYFAVHGMCVDHDYYAPHFSPSNPPPVSYINVDGQTMRLLLYERFDGTEEEYAEKLRERNKRVQDEIDRWERGEVTRNDHRILLDAGLKSEPRFNEPLPPEELAAALKLFHQNKKFNNIT